MASSSPELDLEESKRNQSTVAGIKGGVSGRPGRKSSALSKLPDGTRGFPVVEPTWNPGCFSAAESFWRWADR